MRPHSPPVTWATTSLAATLTCRNSTPREEIGVASSVMERLARFNSRRRSVSSPRRRRRRAGARVSQLTAQSRPVQAWAVASSSSSLVLGNHLFWQKFHRCEVRAEGSVIAIGIYSDRQIDIVSRTEVSHAHPQLCCHAAPEALSAATHRFSFQCEPAGSRRPIRMSSQKRPSTVASMISHLSRHAVGRPMWPHSRG